MNVKAKTVLILAANPQGTSQLRLDWEVRAIDKVLRGANKRDKFRIEQKWATRSRDVHRALLDVKPYIVHFCGHGEGENGLVLEDQTGSPHLVSANALSGLFELYADQLECVLLNACYAAVQANAIVQHIHYVIGMRQAIQDDLAIVFSSGFYKSLGEGQSIEEAFQAGCKAIQQQVERAGSSDRKLTPVDTSNKHSAEVLPYHQIPVLLKKETC